MSARQDAELARVYLGRSRIMNTADVEALRVIRVLDGWTNTKGSVAQAASGAGGCVITLRTYSWRGKHSTSKSFPGATPDEARSSAAAAIEAGEL